MGKKTVDFQAKISEVKQVNPLFSTCKVRVLYTGKNRNMSIITKEAVEKALPTIKNIPIIGEFSTEKTDWKGHGGAIDMDSYDFIHTTKPYGVVPESATYEWENVGGREYLTIDGCYLWTGRYSEAYSVIEQGKGQSMEIEVTNGTWIEEEEAYRIDNFTFSALCILGDDVTPAFEDAKITAYSLNKEAFQLELSEMLSELKTSLNEKEVAQMDKLKEMLVKYSTTMEELTAKGLDFNEISEDELEAKIAEALAVETSGEAEATEADPADPAPANEENAPAENENDPAGQEADPAESDPAERAEADPENEVDPEEIPGDTAIEGADAPLDEDLEVPAETADKASEVSAEMVALQDRIKELEAEVQSKDEELTSLQAFKLNIEKNEHEAAVQALFTNFQLTEEDVKSLDIHAFSMEEIEEKCYAILGRKMATKKNFSKVKEEGNIHLPVGSESNQEDEDLPYGGLIEKYKNKK